MKIIVIEKCFAVLEAMARQDCPVLLKELAQTTDLPKATLHRVLQTLIALGYVVQDPVTGSYQVTMQLAHLGRSRSLDGIRRRVLPLMESLHQRFNETVNLGVLQGSHVYYVDFIETTRNLRSQVHPSARDPFHCTALGRAIVAHLPATEQKTLLEWAVLTPRTPATITDCTTIASNLDVARKRGWALDDEENDIGVTCIGIPVLDGGRPIASISISVPKSRLPAGRQQELVAAMLEIRAAAQTGVAPDRPEAAE